MHRDSYMKEMLDKYSDMAISIIADIIPEFVYYIRFAEFMKKLEAKGFKLTKAHAVKGSSLAMDAKGFYNFKLAVNLANPKELVVNDLVFDDEHRIYILTGANRGGKTTATQGIGLLFALAQGGVYAGLYSLQFRANALTYDADKTRHGNTTDAYRATNIGV